MNNINILVEAKKEYTSQLQKILKPRIYEGFKSIYDDIISLLSKELEETKTQGSSLVRTFQKMLKEIPQWNQEMINKEYSRIEKLSNCDYMPNLIEAVFITNTKILTSVQINDNKSLNIKINIPQPPHFIHKCYIKCANEIYKNPYIFDQSKNLTPKEKHNNLREALSLIDNAINLAISDLLPIGDILKQGLTKNNLSMNELENDSENNSENESENDDEDDSENDEDDDDNIDIAVLEKNMQTGGNFNLDVQKSLQSGTGDAIRESIGSTPDTQVQGILVSSQLIDNPIHQETIPQETPHPDTDSKPFFSLHNPSSQQIVSPLVNNNELPQEFKQIIFNGGGSNVLATPESNQMTRELPIQHLQHIPHIVESTSEKRDEISEMSEEASEMSKDITIKTVSVIPEIKQIVYQKVVPSFASKIKRFEGGENPEISDSHIIYPKKNVIQSNRAKEIVENVLKSPVASFASNTASIQKNNQEGSSNNAYIKNIKNSKFIKNRIVTNVDRNTSFYKKKYEENSANYNSISDSLKDNIQTTLDDLKNTQNSFKVFKNKIMLGSASSDEDEPSQINLDL